jgi:hypothetical protein
MGEEIIDRGEVIVRRPDRQELLDIKEGRWSYEMLLEEAEALMSRIRTRMKERETLAVPEYPDIEALEALCVELSQAALARREGK